MFLARDWHRTLCLRTVRTISGRLVRPLRWVERRTFEGPGGDIHEYRLPLYRPKATERARATGATLA